MNKNMSQKFALIGIILVTIGVFLPVVGLAIPSPLSTVRTRVIRVVDADGAPISGAQVFLFAGGGGIEAKEAADYSFVTDAEGIVDLTGITGFYRVGVIKNGYESADSTHIPTGEWVNIYSAWGAAGITSNMNYAIRLKYTGISNPTVTPTPSAEEPTDTEKTVLGQVFNYVTLSGIGFVAAGLVLNRRKK